MKYLKILVLLSLFGCNSELKEFYPYGSLCLTDNADEKSFYPGNVIYLDNSKIKDFELLMVYNTRDTVSCESQKKKIFVIDTLKFKVSENGVVSLNNKYPVEANYNIFIQGENLISVYNGQNIEIIIKKNERILQSYNTKLEYFSKSGEKFNYQHILNPLSLSIYELDTVQYGGYIFEGFKSKRFFNKFITVHGGRIDYFMSNAPDTLTYSEKRIGEYSFDPCLIGCKKSIFNVIN